jgi:hypothetical protein
MGDRDLGKKMSWDTDTDVDACEREEQGAPWSDGAAVDGVDACARVRASEAADVCTDESTDGGTDEGVPCAAEQDAGEGKRPFSRRAFVALGASGVAVAGIAGAVALVPRLMRDEAEPMPQPGDPAAGKPVKVDDSRTPRASGPTATDAAAKGGGSAGEGAGDSGDAAGDGGVGSDGDAGDAGSGSDTSGTGSGSSAGTGGGGSQTGGGGSGSAGGSGGNGSGGGGSGSGGSGGGGGGASGGGSGSGPGGSGETPGSGGGGANNKVWHEPWDEWKESGHWETTVVHHEAVYGERAVYGAKCSDCPFVTTDPDAMFAHLEATGHRGYATGVQIGTEPYLVQEAWDEETQTWVDTSCWVHHEGYWG